MSSQHSSMIKESNYAKITQDLKAQEAQMLHKNDSIEVLKTIAQKHGIKRSKQLIETLLKKEVVMFAYETAIGKDVGELKIFNQYFTTNDFNAFKINENVKDNALLFTMMYVFYKFDWKTHIECLDE